MSRDADSRMARFDTVTADELNVTKPVVLTKLCGSVVALMYSTLIDPPRHEPVGTSTLYEATSDIPDISTMSAVGVSTVKPTTLAVSLPSEFSNVNDAPVGTCTVARYEVCRYWNVAWDRIGSLRAKVTEDETTVATPMLAPATLSVPVAPARGP